MNVKTLVMAAVSFTPGLAYGFPDFLGSGPFTVIDPSVLAERVADNQQALQEHIERSRLNELGMDQEALLNAAQIDANNNAMANATARSNQRQTDIYNLEAARQGNPADSCGSFAISHIMDSVLCQTQTRIETATARTDLVSLAGVIGLEGALGISNESSSDEPLQFESKDLGFVSPLLGAPVSHTANVAEQVLSGIGMMAPSTRLPVARREFADAEALSLMQEVVRGNLPQKSLLGIENRRAEVDGFSEAGALQLFANMHFSGERTEELSTGNGHNDASLWRERYTSLAFRVWRTVNEYEISLNQEVLAAVRLLELIDPPQY